MTAPAPYICELHFALRHSGRFWVLCFQHETQLAYSWQSRSFCWHLIQSGGAPERLEYISIWPINHCIFANLSCNKVSLCDIEYVSENMSHWLTYSYQSCSFCWHIIGVRAYSDPHHTVSDTETRLRNWWQSCTFRCWLFPGLWLKFRYNWSLPSSPEWGSSISTKPTVTSCNSL